MGRWVPSCSVHIGVCFDFRTFLAMLGVLLTQASVSSSWAMFAWTLLSMPSSWLKSWLSSLSHTLMLLSSNTAWFNSSWISPDTYWEPASSTPYPISKYMPSLLSMGKEARICSRNTKRLFYETNWKHIKNTSTCFRTTALEGLSERVITSQAPMEWGVPLFRINVFIGDSLCFQLRRIRIAFSLSIYVV